MSLPKTSNSKYAILVAGGKGLRLGSDLPKQFLELQGLPILMHTILAFKKADSAIEVILVLPNEHLSFWQELITKYSFQEKHDVVIGGQTRFQSVHNGLRHIESAEGLVAIHDGVRPLVTAEIINTSFEVASREGSAVAAVASKDSLRQKKDGHTISVDRSDFYLVQTPQTFRLSEIKEAFKADEKSSFTDDASVYEDSGKTVCLIDGSYRNIKITTKEDLLIASAMISSI